MNTQLGDYVTAATTIGQMVKLLSEAAQNAGAKLEHIKPLWSDKAIWKQIVLLLLGTHKLTPKTDKELIVTSQLSDEARKEAVKRVRDDQSFLKGIATNHRLPDWLRKKVFNEIEDETFIASYVMAHVNDDSAVERIPTMSDITALAVICTAANKMGTLIRASSRLYALSPAKAIEITCQKAGGALFLIECMTKPGELSEVAEKASCDTTRSLARHRLAEMGQKH